MKRRVIQIAGSTQLISLPRKWAIEHNIMKGDELIIKQEGKSIIVSTDDTVLDKEKEISIDITQIDRDSILFLIRTLYLNGYTTIKLEFKKETAHHLRLDSDVPVVEVILREVNRLNGIEIFQHRKDHIIIKSISKDSAKELNPMIRRIFLMTQDCLEDFKEGIKTGNETILGTIQTKHDTITKFIAYSLRITNNDENLKRREAILLFHLLEKIDNIIDQIKFSSRDILNKKIKLSKEVVQIIEQIETSFRRFRELYYKFNPEKIKEINSLRYSTKKLIEKISPKIKQKEMIVVSNLRQIQESLFNLSFIRLALEY